MGYLNTLITDIEIDNWLVEKGDGERWDLEDGRRC